MRVASLPTPRRLVRVLHARWARARHAGAPLVLVGTHHKTGTVWMKSVFNAIAAASGQRFHGGERAALPSDAGVFFQAHSRFDLPTLPVRYRGVHLIRDPRDIVISGASYHLTATERWLDRPDPLFLGRTYRQMLARERTEAGRIRFEMRHSGRRTIRAMLRWDYGDPDILEVRYEDLIQDTDLVLFRRIFAFLGYPEASLDQLCRIAWEKSLFSGQVQNARHVRSGAPRQWRSVFDRELAQEFQAAFGDALVRLGYEPDDGWCR